MPPPENSERREKRENRVFVRLSRNIAVVCVDFEGECVQYGPRSRSGSSPERAAHVSPGQSEASPRVTRIPSPSRAESPLQTERNPTGGIAQSPESRAATGTPETATAPIGRLAIPGERFLHKTRSWLRLRRAGLSRFSRLNKAVCVALEIVADCMDSGRSSLVDRQRGFPAILSRRIRVFRSSRRMSLLPRVKKITNSCCVLGDRRRTFILVCFQRCVGNKNSGYG